MLALAEGPPHLRGVGGVFEHHHLHRRQTCGFALGSPAGVDPLNLYERPVVVGCGNALLLGDKLSAKDLTGPGLADYGEHL